MKKFAAILLVTLLLSGCTSGQRIQPNERVASPAAGTFKVIRAETAPKGSRFTVVEFWQDRWGNCYAVPTYFYEIEYNAMGGITQVPKEACE